VEDHLHLPRREGCLSGDLWAPGSIGDVTVQMLEGAGITKKGVKSMASNSIGVMVDQATEDPAVIRVVKVSSTVIDLDATGMEEVSSTVSPVGLGFWHFAPCCASHSCQSLFLLRMITDALMMAACDYNYSQSLRKGLEWVGCAMVSRKLSRICRSVSSTLRRKFDGCSSWKQTCCT